LFLDPGVSHEPLDTEMQDSDVSDLGFATLATLATLQFLRRTFT